MAAMERLYEVIGGGSIRVGSDDLEWPWKVGQIFQADLITLVPFDLERPNSAVGDEHVSWG